MKFVDAWHLHDVILKPVRLLVLSTAFGFPAWSANSQSIYSQAYTFSTFAGRSSIGSTDGAGSDALFNRPYSVTADTLGNIYVADTESYTIRKITSAGNVSTIAGFVGVPGSADGANSIARFNVASSLAADTSGNIYVADKNNDTIRMMTEVGTNWIVRTIAGVAGAYGTNDGIGTQASFQGPWGIATDTTGNLYVSDYGNSTIRKITRVGTNWMVSTIAGLSGNYGANDGIGTSARFHYPEGVAVDSAGNVYVADSYNDTIRKVTPSGSVTTLAGLSLASGTNDGTGSVARFDSPSGVAVDTNGNIYVADELNGTIRKVTPVGTNWVVSTFAGNASFANQLGYADGTGSNARFFYPQGVAVDTNGNVYVADTQNNAIRKITSAAVVSTIAGAGAISQGSANGTGSAAQFKSPFSAVVDNAGNVFVADTYNSTIRKITSAEVVSTIAGSAGSDGSADGAGSVAQFYFPDGVAVDIVGNAYVADTTDATIRKITPAGVVTTLAGLAASYGSADGTGSAARFNGPAGVAVDTHGNVYVAEIGNDTIRKVTQAGVVTTLAGLAQISGTNDGTGSAARFKEPFGIAVDSAGNLYVADFGNSTIRKVTPVGTNWAVSTLAGIASLGNQFGYADGPGNTARFYGPSGVAVDNATNIYVADSGTFTIRKITPVGSNWMVSTIGGSGGISGSSDGTGASALFTVPQGIAVDSAGNVFVADTDNNTIRKGVFTQYGTANVVSNTPPSQTGQLQVTLLPPEANGQWRFPWEFAWHKSGFTATNLSPGNYPVEFRNLPGWLAIPANLTTIDPAVVPPGTTSQVTNHYYPTIAPSDANSTAGSLSIFLGVNPPAGAGWRFLGDTTPYFPSGFTTNLLPGIYLIQFAGPFANRSTPPTASVPVFAGQPTFVSVSYPFASAPAANVLTPTPVLPNQIPDVADYPFGFNGQLQSDIGYCSGVAVQSNVVLTVAHLVFNDFTLSYVSGTYWFLQQELPSYLPSPLTARGWYVLSGYASQRSNDLASGNFGPDVSSPQSRNADVAALYFQTAVASGGYSGYLPSDQVPNQWLTSTAEKILVGYPVDGSQYADTTITNGLMYEIGPQPYPLTLSADSVTNQQEVYTASWFLSYPGNSGGPLYVQLNGYYYPAGVYLGTLNGQPVVRAIDSNVVSLITNAATLGDNGTNNPGGGPVPIIPDPLSAANPGYLQIQLQPPSAVQAGAGWKLQGDSTFASNPNFTRAVTATNAAVVFNPIPGWNLPTNQSINLIAGYLTTNTAFYTVLPPKLVFHSQGIGLSGTTNTTYRIESTTSVKNPVWTSLSTNTITNSTFNLVVSKTNSPATTFYRAVWLNH